MKKTVTLYIHKNLDYCERNSSRVDEFYFFTFDASDMDHMNCVLVGTQEVEVAIPDVDYREKAVAKFDKQIADIETDAACRVRQIDAKKQELLAIGNEA